MVRSIQDRLSGVRSRAAWAAALAGVVGGALLLQASVAIATGSGSLADVRVEASGEETTVHLTGAQDAVYSAYRLSEPDRLVVELAGVQSGQGEQSWPGSGATVSGVRTASDTAADGQAQTRVEIDLASDVNYDVWSDEQGMVVRLTATAPVAEAAPAALPESPAAPAPPSEVAAAPAADSAKVALRGIDVRSIGAESVIVLEADGPLEQVEAFTLEHPDRLVVDLAGVRDASPSTHVEIGSELASRARIGAHPGKVRVVIDAGGAVDPFGNHQIETVDEGLRITLGAAPAAADTLETAAMDAPALAPEAAPEPANDPVADPVADWTTASTRSPEPAVAESETALLAAVSADEEPVMAETSPAPEVAPTPEPTVDVVPSEPVMAEPVVASDPEPVEVPASIAEVSIPESNAIRVDGVEVQRDAVGDRVAITANRPLDFRVVKPDPDTLIVRLPGARLEPDAQVHLAPDGRGPVSLVSSFQQPDMEGDEARVVLTRAAGLEPRVSTIGSTLVLDFPRVQEEAAAPLLPVATDAVITPAAAQRIVPASASDSSPAILAEGGFTDEKLYAGRRISLDFKDVEINDVLRLIAEVSDLNIIAGDEVTGNITIRLVDVPWDQALDVILLTKGLGFERVGNVLRIAPSELLKQEEEARLQERRAKEKLEDLVVKLQPVNYADVAEIENMVKRLLTERGTVNTDKRTNTVIIKDIPSVIDEATALIKSIDTQTPQVLIESKIVEASLDYSRELGSQWAFGVQPLTDAFDATSPARQNSGGGDFRLNDQGQFFPGNPFGSNNVVVQNPISSVANGLLDIGAFLIGEDYNIELLLQAAESSGEGKVISSPRVVTLDNREALIEQGVSIPFQTFENGDAQLEFIDAVLSLKVTPHITADKSIIMKIEVTRNAPDGSVPTPTGSPAIAKNQARTETLVSDGQTLVLGGIYVVDKGENFSGVPFFRKIPIIGHAFRNQEVRDIRKELLIFVTPQIVRQADAAL